MNTIFATLIAPPEVFVERLTELGLTEVVNGETMLRSDLERPGHGQSLLNPIRVWDKPPVSDDSGVTNGATLTGQAVWEVLIRGPVLRHPGPDALNAALFHAASDAATAAFLGEVDVTERSSAERLRAVCAAMGIAYTYAVQHYWLTQGEAGTFTGWAGNAVPTGAALRTVNGLSLVVAE